MRASVPGSSADLARGGRGARTLMPVRAATVQRDHTCGLPALAREISQRMIILRITLGWAVAFIALSAAAHADLPPRFVAEPVIANWDLAVGLRFGSDGRL